MISFCFSCGSPSNSFWTFMIQLLAQNSQRFRRGKLYSCDVKSDAILMATFINQVKNVRNLTRGCFFELNSNLMITKTNDNTLNSLKIRPNVCDLISPHVRWTVKTFSVPHSICDVFVLLQKLRQIIAVQSRDILDDFIWHFMTDIGCRLQSTTWRESKFPFQLTQTNSGLWLKKFFLFEIFVFLGRWTHLCLFCCLLGLFMQTNIKFISHTCHREMRKIH